MSRRIDQEKEGKEEKQEEEEEKDEEEERRRFSRERITQWTEGELLFELLDAKERKGEMIFQRLS